MSNKQFLITEDEKKYILSMYGIINENNQGNPKKLTVGAQEFFDSGFHSKLSKEGINKLTIELNKALNFLKLNAGKTTSIKILASEDKNQNYDNEVSPAKIIPTGQLAQLRANTIKTFLENFFKIKVQEGVIDKIPTFEPPQLIVGKGTTPAEQAFDRRIEIEFSVVGDDLGCLDGLMISLYYEDGKDVDHGCNSAVYEVRINNILLTGIDGKPFGSLNNTGNLENTTNKIQGWTLSDGNRGGSRRSVFVVNSEMAKQLLEPKPDGTTNEKFQISLTCKNAGDFSNFGGKPENHGKYGNGCHRDAVDMSFKSKKNSVVKLRATGPAGKDEEKVVATINACGFII
jgi:hypothetical protein